MLSKGKAAITFPRVTSPAAMSSKMPKGSWKAMSHGVPAAAAALRMASAARSPRFVSPSQVACVPSSARATRSTLLVPTRSLVISAICSSNSSTRAATSASSPSHDLTSSPATPEATAEAATVRSARSISMREKAANLEPACTTGTSWPSLFATACA